MPSTHDHSAGAPATARRRSAPPGNTGNDDALTVLAAESEAAVARLVASIDWPRHEALLAELADQSDRAVALLLAAHNDHLPTSTVPVVQSHAGVDPT